MQQKELRVITKLGKACALLKTAEAMPEMQKCTGTIRRARFEIEEAVSVLKKKKAVDLEKVSEILRVLTKAYTFLKLLGLGDS